MKRNKKGQFAIGFGTTHGMSGTRPYIIWENMIQRCRNKNLKHYKHYGGRGIKVCKKWENSFEAFWKDMKNGYRKDLEVDRIDNNGNYEPENCRWVTHEEQCNNMRSNFFIKFKGRKRSLSQWAREIGIFEETLWYRLKKFGWPIKKALTKPVKKYNFESKKISIRIK